MKSSFANAEEVLETPAPAASPNVPAVTGSAEIVDDGFFSNDGFEGEIDEKVIRTPYLSLAHGVGGLAEAGFTPGSLVYNKEVSLADAKKGVIPLEDAVEIIFLKGFSEYVEDISDSEYKSGVKARRFKTEAEARAAGLMLGKEKRACGDDTARTYRASATFKVLVTGKQNSEALPFEFGGKNYALAAITFSKGSYWSAGTPALQFVNDCRMLKRPLYWKSFKLTAELKKFQGATNASWVMKLTPGAKLSDEQVAWIKDLNA